MESATNNDGAEEGNLTKNMDEAEKDVDMQEEEVRHDDVTETTSESDSQSDEEDDDITSLREQLKINPYHYETHIKLIAALRDMSNLKKLREAREEMSRIFPLTEELWLEWINDEAPLAAIPEQKDYLISLFERAVKDYLSVKIWLEYCQFVMDRIDDAESIQVVRNVFEKAIVAVGLHLTEGSAIWDGYREFEMSILQSYQQLQDVDGGSKVEEKVQSQISKVMTIFRRQLSVPLLGMQQTMREFEDWTPEPVSDAIESQYEKALKKMEECLTYEEALKNAESPKLEEYQQYIAYEVKDGSPARVQCIFERALRDNCLNSELWIQYTDYLDFKLKVPSVAQAVHERAVRNCPWISLLWQNYIRALERSQCEKGKVKATLDQALQCGFATAEDYVQLWLTYLDFIRRKVDSSASDEKSMEEVRKAFESATEYITTYFGEAGDSSSKISKFWAFVEAGLFKDLRKGQDRWDNIMKRHSKEAHMWLEYTHFLRVHGNVILTRHVFQRAMQIIVDDPHMLSTAFLDFERQEGDLRQFDSAQQRMKELINKWSLRKQKDEQKETAAKQYQAEQMEIKKQEKSKKKAEKRKLVRESKRIHNVEPTETAVPEDASLLQNTEPERKKIKGDKVGVSEKVEGEEKVLQCTDERNAVEERKKEDRNTVFLSNLLFTVDEDQIKNMFQKCGDIVEIRLVKNRAGKSKGYAYLEFSNEAAVTKALEMDRESLCGRPVFVSPMVDKSKHPTQFKFSNTLDKVTVFVSNMPFTVTEEEVRTCFQEAGNIKQVRLVTNRSGKPKGYGYIEFEDEISASNAVMKLDGKDMKDRKIQVALSNPPARKSKGETSSKEPEKQTYGSRGRARTQLAMMPRALARPKETLSVTTGPDESTASNMGTMSNADFRKLLGQK